MDMDLVVIGTVIFATSVGFPLARAIARRIEQRGLSSNDAARLHERLEAIEMAVDAIAVEVERISEAQRFTTKLLSGQSGSESAEAASVAAPDHRLQR